MRKLILLLVVFMLQSCNYFEAKKISKEAIVKEEFKTFNWEDVDTYPSFKNCDLLEEKEDKRACFETEITNHFYDTLTENEFLITEDLNDTINLHLLIDQKGRVSLKQKLINASTMRLIPNIDSILNQGIIKMPKIYPAIKRGQLVQTEFVLPIHIQVSSL